jgi:hypothetical protein
VASLQTIITKRVNWRFFAQSLVQISKSRRRSVGAPVSFIATTPVKGANNTLTAALNRLAHDPSRSGDGLNNC